MRNITVIGTGYVGLVAAVGLADFGNTVIGVDIDDGKIEKLNNGIPTIYETGIEEYLIRNLEAQRLSFTNDIDTAIQKSEVVFLAVGTPPNHDGSADLSQIYGAAAKVAENLDGYKIVVTKSTVPVGTNRGIKEAIEKLTPGREFDVVSNPEFLREGKAVHDFFHPDRIVIGCESDRAREILEDIYRALYLIQSPFIWCGIETAELIKYASNAFLATKITFINQMANLAEAIGADIHMIAKAMGMDGRISAKFLHPGPGYGGSCFPKDTRAIASFGEQYGVDMSLIKETIRANEAQKKRMVSKLKKHLPELKGKTIALLGLAFKAETDDVRESPALAIAGELIKEGAVVRGHDPKAEVNFEQNLSAVECFDLVSLSVEAVDAVIIITEWNEYRTIDLGMLKEKMRGNIIIDTRNVLYPEDVREAGFIYEGVGR